MGRVRGARRWLAQIVGVKVFAVVVGVVFGTSPSATTLVPVDFSEMARESDLIVHGTVVNVTAQMSGARNTIESVVTLWVTDTIKGAALSQAVFRVPGGRVGRYRRVMVGAPTFREGDEVIVFLKGTAPAAPMPYGLSQGVYRVARRGAAATVTPLIASEAGRVTRGDPSRRPLAPTAFAAEVRRVLTGAAAAPIRRAIPRPR